MRIYRGLVGIHKHGHLHSISNRASLKSNVRSLWILLVAFCWARMLTQSRTSLAFFNKMHSDRYQHVTTVMGIFLWKDLTHGTDSQLVLEGNERANVFHIFIFISFFYIFFLPPTYCMFTTYVIYICGHSYTGTLVFMVIHVNIVTIIIINSNYSKLNK